MDGLRGQERSVGEEQEGEQEWENERGGEEGNRLDAGCIYICVCVVLWVQGV